MAPLQEALAACLGRIIGPEMPAFLDSFNEL